MPTIASLTHAFDTIEPRNYLLSLSPITVTIAEESLEMVAKAVTELVQVPSSEHVAQIVGKKGAKIKLLRATTNTNIKTPHRGDLPEFVITGDEVGVQTAKEEILKAAQHFTNIMNARSTVPVEGEITIRLAVQRKYIGFVVGRNGAVIKKIKEQTKTQINTPKTDNPHPEFEITGLEVNVLAAKEAILDKVHQAHTLNGSEQFDPGLLNKKHQPISDIPECQCFRCTHHEQGRRGRGRWRNRTASNSQTSGQSPGQASGYSSSQSPTSITQLCYLSSPEQAPPLMSNLPYFDWPQWSPTTCLFQPDPAFVRRPIIKNWPNGNHKYGNNNFGRSRTNSFNRNNNKYNHNKDVKLEQ